MSKFQLICLTLFIFIFSNSVLNAQNTVRISGTAIDEIADQPVEAATVFLSAKKDSTVIDYTITDVNGNFKLDVKKINEPVFFRITDDLSGEYEQEFDQLTEDKNLGRIKLSMKIDLEGVVISGAPPVRIKNDTLEFNASSFKVRPDANVETLLRQLPGVDIDEDGKITVNGKEVNQILVNGKPFFNKDGKIALENLPADIINKVQVTDTKTKKEELAGEKASGNEATINLTIDEEKNKGYMLKAMGGYGTDDRYESSLMLNYFKGNTKLSLLGSSNNINSVGFSMNEIFDNMGSMRSSSVFVNDNGSFGINGMRFGGGKGITQSNLGGISYSDNFGKDIDFNGSYFYTQTDSKNNNYSRNQNLLPDNIFTTESRNRSRNQSFAHNFNTSFEVKLDSTATIWFEPKYNSGKIKTSSVFENLTLNENGDLLNESNGENSTDGLNQSFSNEIEFFKTFKDKSSMSLSISNNNQRNNNNNLNISNTYFYQTEEPDDIRNQLTHQIDKQDKYKFRLEYNFKITDSVKLGVGSSYGLEKSHKVRETFDFDGLTTSYTQFNDLLSSDISSDLRKVSPFAAFKIQKDKLYFNLSTGVQFLNQKNSGFYNGNLYELNQDKIVPEIEVYGNYQFGKNASIYMNYSLRENFGSADQLLAIENLANPLNTIIGNPDLKTNKTHSLYFGWNNFNFQAKTGYNIYFGGNYDERGITAFKTTDANFKSNTTYVNVNGNYSLWAGVNVNKSFSKDNNKFRIGFGLGGSHSYNQGFINGVKYDAWSYNIRPRINFNWELKDVLIINPSYNLNYRFTNYNNFRIDKTDNIAHIFKISTTNYQPKHFVFGNDFSYTYNSNIASGFKKDFFLWNTSLAYNFMKDQLTFKVKVYDVLGQNTGTSRTITSTMISDVQDDVLTRYVMFSLGFKLDKFGGKGRRGNRIIVLD